MLTTNFTQLIRAGMIVDFMDYKLTNGLERLQALSVEAPDKDIVKISLYFPKKFQHDHPFIANIL